MGALISRFIDTNVLLYAFGEDERGEIARRIMADGGVIAVQSLNEFINVARRKHGRRWSFVRDAIVAIRSVCLVSEAAHLKAHEQAIELAETHGFNIHDAMLIAIALQSGCDEFLSEDMHHGLVIDDRLVIVNPFRT